MEKDGLIKNIRKSLAQRRETRNLDDVDTANRNLMVIFDSIEATKDIGLAFKSFGIVLKDTKKYHINDDHMKASINTALKEWEGATKTLPKAYSQELYQSTEEDHFIDKKRVDKKHIEGGRANDQVRMFLTSQEARVRNECKSMSGDGYKAFLNAQIRCLLMMEKEYKKLQDKVMGREPEIKKGKSRGMER